MELLVPEASSGSGLQLDSTLPSPCSPEIPRPLAEPLSCHRDAAAAATPPNSPRYGAIAHPELFAFHAIENDVATAGEILHEWKSFSLSPSKSPPPPPPPSGRETAVRSTKNDERKKGRMKLKDLFMITGAEREQSDLQNCTQEKKSSEMQPVRRSSAACEMYHTPAARKKLTFLPYHLNTIFACMPHAPALRRTRRAIGPSAGARSKKCK